MRARLTVAVVLLAIVGSACGGDEGEATGGDPDRFCALDTELGAVGDFVRLPPDEARAAAETFTWLLIEAQAAAPDAIRMHVDAVVLAYDDLFAAIRAVDFDGTRLGAEPQLTFTAAADLAAKNALGAGQETFTDWTAEHC